MSEVKVHLRTKQGVDVAFDAHSLEVAESMVKSLRARGYRPVVEPRVVSWDNRSPPFRPFHEAFFGLFGARY